MILLQSWFYWTCPFNESAHKSVPFVQESCWRVDPQQTGFAEKGSFKETKYFAHSFAQMIIMTSNIERVFRP